MRYTYHGGPLDGRSMDRPAGQPLRLGTIVRIRRHLGDAATAALLRDWAEYELTDEHAGRLDFRRDAGLSPLAYPAPGDN